jgi:hypothetical protein
MRNMVQSYRSEPGLCEMELPHRRAAHVSKGFTALGLLRVARNERRIRALDDIV